MAKTAVISTKLPLDLKQILDKICLKLGLKKNFVIESALREKLEDLLDTSDLLEAMKEAGGFHALGDTKLELRKRGKV